jgi:type I restriction enzyme S subunit
MNNHTRPGWTCKKLDELGFVGRGKSKHRPRNDPSLYGGVYPFIQTGDVKAANLCITEYTQTYSEKGLAQSKLWSPGTLLITIAANIAETAILKIKACFPDSIVGFVADPEKAEVRFVNYCINVMKLRMQSISRGTTQDNLSVDKLLSFDFCVPDVTIQRKIAAILSAYDDLIENNTRRIKILEEMAQALYREWFVHFRFPGHEKVKMVDSPSGEIPNGWHAKQLRELAQYINRGISPQYDENASGLVINQKCIRDGRLTLDAARRQSKKVPPEKLVSFGDILINSTGIGTLGRVAQVYEDHSDCTIDSHVTIVRPANEFSVDFLGLTLIGMETHFDHLGAGSTGQTELSRELVSNSEVLTPRMELQKKFSEIVRPLRLAVIVESKQMRNLRRTRDLLLPKLISGEIDVSNLDIR